MEMNNEGWMLVRMCEKKVKFPFNVFVFEQSSEKLNLLFIFTPNNLKLNRNISTFVSKILVVQSSSTELNRGLPGIS